MGETFQDKPGSIICVPATCPRGKYGDASKTGITKPPECTNCTAGRFNPSTGVSRLEDCSPCPLGRYGSDPGSKLLSGCKTCPMFTHGVSEGQADKSLGCGSCGTGTYQDETGKVSCKPASCPAGQWGSKRPNCSNCDAGKYNPSQGAGSPDKCFDCPQGRFGASEGSERLDDCALCQPGTFGDASGLVSANCSGLCPAGTHSPSAGMTECLNCTPGTYHDGRSTTRSALARCKTCGAGRYQDEDGASSCKPCPSGKFGDLGARTSENDCKPLPPGFFSKAEGLDGFDNNTAVQLCAPGKYGSASGEASEAACKLCDSGRFTESAGKDKCMPCPAGTTSSSDRSQCGVDLAVVIPIVATLLGLLAPAIYFFRRRLRHRQKYALVTVGRRQRGRCCVHQWKLQFPRRSRFARNDIAEGAKLGNGAFGEVNAGTLQVGKAALRIAVKHVLESKATDAQRQDTIVECRLQCELESPFVVKCFGFTTGPGPGDFSILLELMDIGDLPQYVKSVVGEAGGRIPEATRLRWMIDVAAALEYMHASNLIHADVAARNLCLCHSKTGIACKLTDFGLSHAIDPGEGAYLLPRGTAVPIPWTSPECLPCDANFVNSNIYGRGGGKRGQQVEGLRMTPDNDVWSFGVTIWEIECLAATGEQQKPFAETPTKDLRMHLMTKKAKLDFDFSANDRAIDTFKNPAEVAVESCLRVRPWARATMTDIRRRLQAASLCDANDWEHDDIKKWLDRMGAPRVDGADLWEIDNYEELIEEILNDETRPDYIAELELGDASTMWSQEEDRFASSYS